MTGSPAVLVPGVRLVVFCVAALTFVSARAAAQAPPPSTGPRPERPYRGLFGGGRADLSQSLVVAGSLGAAHVRRTEGLVFDGSGNPQPPSATFGYGTGNISYNLSLPRFTVSGGGFSAVDFQPRNDIFATRYGFGVNSTYIVTPNFTVSAGLGAQPLSSTTALQRLTDLSANPPQDNIENALESGGVYVYSLTAGANYHRAITTRMNFTANYSYSTGFYTGQIVDVHGHGADVGLSYAITRDLHFHVGYVYSLGYFTENDKTTVTRGGRFDIGVDYSKGKTMKLARRTTLSFAGGIGAVSDGQSTHFSFVGNVSLNHEMGRSWMAAITYNRSLGFVSAFVAPVLADSVTASLGGLITRRLQFTSQVGASRGLVGFGDANGFFTLAGGAGLTYGISRYAALQADYSFSRSSFDPGIRLIPGLSPRNAVQSFRVSFTASAPIWQSRRRNVTR